MERTLNRQELEQQLSGKAESIGRRLDALQEEVGGLSVRRFVQGQPLISAGAVVAAGFLTGLLLGGRKRESGDGTPRDLLQKELVERYIETVADEARHLVTRGKDVSEAVSRALRGRVPVIVYKPSGEREPRGFFLQIAQAALKSASVLAVNLVVELAASRLRSFSDGDASLSEPDPDLPAST